MTREEVLEMDLLVGIEGIKNEQFDIKGRRITLGEKLVTMVYAMKHNNIKPTINNILNCCDIKTPNRKEYKKIHGALTRLRKRGIEVYS